MTSTNPMSLTSKEARTALEPTVVTGSHWMRFASPHWNLNQVCGRHQEVRQVDGAVPPPSRLFCWSIVQVAEACDVRGGLEERDPAGVPLGIWRHGYGEGLTGDIRSYGEIVSGYEDFYVHLVISCQFSFSFARDLWTNLTPRRYGRRRIG